jgi:hypothetical protein
MGRQFSLVIILLICACDGFVGEMKLVNRQRVANAPTDAREVAPHTYMKTVKTDNSGGPVETLPVFGYAETINPQSPSDIARSAAGTPAGLVPIRWCSYRRAGSLEHSGDRSLCLVPTTPSPAAAVTGRLLGAERT